MRVAVDIGGTFTDITFSDSGTFKSTKVLSVLDEVGNRISQVLNQTHEPATVEAFVHATTVCSNAIIERNLPWAVFVTTAGFRSLLELRDQRGPLDYAMDWERPEPLIPFDLCFELEERIEADGNINQALAVGDIEALITKLRAAKGGEHRCVPY